MKHLIANVSISLALILMGAAALAQGTTLVGPDVASQTEYIILINSSHQYYNQGAMTFGAEADGSWGNYGIVMTADGTTPNYAVTFPVVAQDVYTVQQYREANAGTIALGDLLVNQFLIVWTGTKFSIAVATDANGKVILQPITHTGATVPTVTNTTQVAGVTPAFSGTNQKVDVEQWNATDVPVPTNAGYPLIDLKYILGTTSAGTAGYAAPDWGHVNAPTTAVALTGTTISTAQIVASVSGNVGGNVVGTVQTVLGNVNGNVTGTVASVLGNVAGNVSGNVTGNVGGSVNSVVTAITLPANPPANFLVSASFAAGCQLPTGVLTNEYGAIATHTWGDVTGTDFTGIGSIGKSLVNGVTLGNPLAMNINLAQTLDATQLPLTNGSADSVGNALWSAIASGGGKQVTTGTSYVVYELSGGTVVRTFTLSVPVATAVTRQ
jgi:hypothetical protein